MSMLTNLDLIRRVPLFSMLTPAQAESLAGAIGKRRFKRGEYIVEQGKKCDSLFIILAGRARVVVTDRRDREVILATLHPGDYLGEMSLIDQEPHSATVEAEVQTDALVLGGQDFNRCLLENNSTMAAVLKGLVQRLRSADRKIESLALMNVYGRVATGFLSCWSFTLKLNTLAEARARRSRKSPLMPASYEVTFSLLATDKVSPKSRRPWIDGAR